MNLAELQAKMLEAVTRVEDADPGLSTLIPPTRGIRPETRLDVYRTNIRGAHLETLDAAYPVTRAVLGPRYWRQLLMQAIPAFGSRSPDLHEYGDFLPELLSRAQKSRQELAEFGYLGELAQLEWQVHLAQFKAPDPDFDWATFQALGSDHQMRVRFTLSHALHGMRFSQPVDALWHSHQKDGQDLPPQAPVTCCVHRQQPFGVTVVRLSDNEWVLLEALADGRCLEALPTKASQTTTQTLFNWIRRGWISGFQEESNHPS